MTRTEYSQRSKERKAQQDHGFNTMIAEMSNYLAKVRNGRSVQAVNPQAPQFSQSADDARLASKGQIPAGYGAPPKPQESFNPNGFGQAFTTPSGASPSYGFTNSYQPSPQAKVFGQAIEALGDERMAGIPAFGGVSKFGKWREFLKGKPKPDMGGFNAPTHTSKPALEDIRDLNVEVARWGDKNPMIRKEAQDRYMKYSDTVQKQLDETWKGREALRRDLEYPSQN